MCGEHWRVYIEVEVVEHCFVLFEWSAQKHWLVVCIPEPDHSLIWYRILCDAVRMATPLVCLFVPLLLNTYFVLVFPILVREQRLKEENQHHYSAKSAKSEYILLVVRFCLKRKSEGRGGTDRQWCMGQRVSYVCGSSMGTGMLYDVLGSVFFKEAGIAWTLAVSKMLGRARKWEGIFEPKLHLCVLATG